MSQRVVAGPIGLRTATTRSLWWRAGGLVVLAMSLGSACGGSEGSGNTDESEALSSVERANLREDYSAAVADNLGFAGSGLDVDAGCMGDAVIDQFGVEALQDAGLDPTEFADLESFEAGGLELTSADTDELSGAIADCFPPGAFNGFLTENLGVAASGDFLTCIEQELGDSVSEVLVIALVTGEEPALDASMVSQWTELGNGCRWATQPETPSSQVTAVDGLRAFADAVVVELSTPPEGFEASGFTVNEAACFTPDLIEGLGVEELERALPTARETARFVYGEGPDLLGFPIDHAQAELLAHSYVECVDFERLMRASMSSFATIPQDVVEAFAQCVAERIPADSLYRSEVITLEEGASGMQGPEGAALVAEQVEAGEQCGAETMQSP